MEKATQYTTKFLKVSVPYTLSLIKPAAGQKVGCMNEASWQSFGTWMKSQKLITETPQRRAAHDRRLPALQLLSARPRRSGRRPLAPPGRHS